MERLDAIARGPHAVGARALTAIDTDPLARAELDARLFRECAVRLDTESEHHHVGEDRTVGGLHDAIGEPSDGQLDAHIDAHPAHRVLDGDGHVRVERGHHLWTRLDDRHTCTALYERLRQLEPDVAAADDHDVATLARPGLVQQLAGVVECLDPVHGRQVDAG